MAERQTTGLVGLDAQLGGGIPPGSVHVLIGDPMNATELFGYHFAAGGAMAGGGAVYVATDLAKEELLEGIKNVGGRPERVKFHPLPNEEDWSLPDLAKDGRYILDSFSIYSRNAGWDAAMQRLGELKEQCRTLGTSILIMCTADLHSKEELAFLQMWADGVMKMGFDRQGFGLYPYLKLTKMRGVPDSGRFLLFKETDKGLFMESTRRVF